MHTLTARLSLPTAAAVMAAGVIVAAPPPPVLRALPAPVIHRHPHYPDLHHRHTHPA